MAQDGGDAVGRESVGVFVVRLEGVEAYVCLDVGMLAELFYHAFI